MAAPPRGRSEAVSFAAAERRSSRPRGLPGRAVALDGRDLMKVRPIADYLGALPFFAGLDAAAVQQLAGCARNEHVRDGAYLFREGGTAEHFYVIIHGRIALEVFRPGSGPIVLD